MCIRDEKTINGEINVIAVKRFVASVVGWSQYLIFAFLTAQNCELSAQQNLLL